MAIIRVNKTKNYITMSNYHFKEKEMSLKAKGLLSEMLSLPDNWNYSIEGLVSINKENETSIKSALNELQSFGYLKITKLMPNQTKSGRIEYIYDIYEKKQEGEKQGIENLGVEFLGVENQEQYNINNKINNNKNINNIKEYKEKFEELWKMYPNKKGKENAYKSFIKAIKDGTDIEIIKQGIEKYNEYIKNKKVEEQYIKHGSTWFNQKCWEDDYKIINNNVPSWFNQNWDNKEEPKETNIELDEPKEVEFTELEKEMFDIFNED